MRDTATDSRGWTVAGQLRARRGWHLDGAHLRRSWAVRLGEIAFEVTAYVSWFLHDSPSMVVALESTFPEGFPKAIADEAVQGLLAALGEGYRNEPQGRRVVRIVRTDQPKPLLAEVAHVEHVLGARVAKRFGPSPRSQDRRRWHVVEALRASSWQIGSLSFSRRVGDQRRQLWASIGVLVDSASGRPGIDASFVAWVPRSSKRWSQFCNDTTAGLAAEGFRAAAREPRFFQIGRWVADLSGTRALTQADRFDQLMEAGADVIGV